MTIRETKVSQELTTTEMFTDLHLITQRIILMKLKNRTLYLDLTIMNCLKLIFIMMKFQTT